MQSSDQQALLSRLGKVVARRADHVAVREQNHEFSYAEFSHMIGHLHHVLDQVKMMPVIPLGNSGVGIPGAVYLIQ